MDTVEFRITLRCGHVYRTQGRNGRLGPVMDGPYLCPTCTNVVMVTACERVVNGVPPLRSPGISPDVIAAMDDAELVTLRRATALDLSGGSADRDWCEATIRTVHAEMSKRQQASLSRRREGP